MCSVQCVTYVSGRSQLRRPARRPITLAVSSPDDAPCGQFGDFLLSRETFSNRSREPLLQDRQLVGLHSRESDTHPRVGNDRYDTTECSECAISLRDSDPKFCACRRRIPRFNKAPADTEFVGPGGTLRI